MSVVTFSTGITTALQDMHWCGVRQGILACATFLRRKGRLDEAMALTLHSDEIAQQTRHDESAA